MATRLSSSSAEQFAGPKPDWTGFCAYQLCPAATVDNSRAARQLAAVELNGSSIECLSVGPADAANRADGLARCASGGEINLQFQNFSDPPLPSYFNEHTASAEIY